MSKPLELNCWVLGDDPGRIFPVKISKNETIGALKKAIKDEKKAAFDHLTSDSLDLWKVNIQVDADITDKLRDLGPLHNPEKGVHKLSPVDELSEVFSDAPSRKHLHIVVQPPPPTPSDVEDLRVKVADLEKQLVQERTKREYTEAEAPVASQRNPISLPALNDEVQVNAVAKAWKAPYSGHSHDLLYNNINAMKRGQPYSNTVSIIQSSGTGKSRMVDQLGHLVFTIPFNLRLDSDASGHAFPLPDAGVRDCLVEAPKSSVDKIIEYYLLFLAQVFNHVQKTLSTKSATSYRQLATDWRDHLERPDVRRVLYNTVVASVKAKRDLDDRSKDFAEEAEAAFNKLSLAMDRCIPGKSSFPESKVKVVIYFDEAHVLVNVPAPGDTKRNLYDVLCSAFDKLRQLSLFVIFLSTNSHLEGLAPSADMARSARVREHFNSLQAPITETPFDCSPDLLVHQKELTMDATCKLEFMARFGRPLFWTMLAGADTQKEQVLAAIVSFARAKLLCQHDIDVSTMGVRKQEGCTAVVDVRLMLDYEPRHEPSRSLQAELVAGHMRIAYSIPQSRQYIRSGYPSEPLLAEAAAQQMRAFRLADPNAILTILMLQVNGGLIDKGERGELVGRELLLSAYDRAIEEEYRQSHPRAAESFIPFYSKGVSLISYLKELFAPRYAEKILSSVPNNVSSTTTLQQAFEHAKVRFTHFGKMADDSGTTTGAVWGALVRGMAIICRSGESYVDVIIPILWSDEKLSEEVVTGLLVQIKRRRERGTVARSEIDEKLIGFFPTEGPPDHPSMVRPYISLVMELGVQNKPPDDATTSTKVTAAVPKPRTRRRSQTPSKVEVSKQGRLAHSRDRHPRYSIFAYGCSDTVYKGITQEQRGIYKLLLASGYFLADHPRLDAESLQAVRRMKPFFSAGESSYHWLDDAKMRNVPREDNADIEDTVLTGFQVTEVSSDDENPFLVHQMSDTDLMAADPQPTGEISGLGTSATALDSPVARFTDSHRRVTGASNRGKRPQQNTGQCRKKMKSKRQ